jgi:uncharacterized membrane protein YcaP (DUF421 family)
VFVTVVFRVVGGRKAMQRWGLSEVALLFLVTIALRQTIVADAESLTSGMIALFTVVGLDRLASELIFRRKRAADVIEGRIVRLVRGGALDRDALASVRISEEELLARVRARGHARLDDVQDAWFERSGDVTIVFKS